jgi:preprotein translocase subunit SecE
MIDKLKLAVAFALVAAGVAGFYTFGDKALILRLLMVVAGVAAAAAVAWTSQQGKAFYVFAQESVAETRKVVWPTRKETLQTTGVVIAFVIVMAIFLWVVDAVLVMLVRFLMKTPGD